MNRLRPFLSCVKKLKRNGLKEESVLLTFILTMSISFLAGLMVKLHESTAWSVEEVQTLKIAAGLLQYHEAKDAKHDEKRIVKKIKTIESQHNTPVPSQMAPSPVEELVLNPVPVVPEVPVVPAVSAFPEVPVVPTTSKLYTPPEIDPNYCIARKVKDVIPGTDVHTVKQCNRRRAKGEVLCPICAKFLEDWKENPKKKKWEGVLTETPLDHLHVEGSKWFHEKYPNGLPMQTQTEAEVPVPADPQQECVLIDAPAKEVKWASLKHDGINYIYNLRDRRVYKADITQEGEDQILWESYEGKWRNGEIDPHYEENEEECWDD